MAFHAEYEQKLENCSGPAPELAELVHSSAVASSEAFQSDQGQRTVVGMPQHWANRAVHDWEGTDIAEVLVSADQLGAEVWAGHTGAGRQAAALGHSQEPVAELVEFAQEPRLDESDLGFEVAVDLALAYAVPPLVARLVSAAAAAALG